MKQSTSLFLAEKPAHNDSGVPLGILVKNVLTGDEIAKERLFRSLHRGVTRILNGRLRGLGDVEDGAQYVCATTLEQLQKGLLRNPDAVGGYARTIALRYAAGAIDNAVQARQMGHVEEVEQVVPCQSQRPDRMFEQAERVAVMRKVLEGLSSKDREVLTRCYLEEQPAQQVCQEMGLTETQLRLLKNRAKNRFAELGRKHIQMHRNLLRSTNRPQAYLRAS